MVNASKTRNLIRDSWRDAAIYGLMADVVDDPERVRRFKRLQEIQTTIARRWSQSAAASVAAQNVGRFSISLVLFRLASKFLNSARIAGFLRSRFRQSLSNNTEEYLNTGLKDEAAESMNLLDQLAEETTYDGQHHEYGSLVTKSGALRAAVLGMNDGLVSNTTLTLGVAAGASDPAIVVLAGTAGLVGGALSMAAGEYISVVSQREFNENLVRWENAELHFWREEEEAEFAEILQSKGLAPDEAKSAAARIMSDHESALEMHVREELSIDPDELGGSPLTAAFSSLVAFAGGAAIPLIPYAVSLSGPTSITVSALTSGIALAIVGGGLGWMSGSGKVYGAMRMLLVGVAAGAITFGLGSLVGQQLG